MMMSALFHVALILRLIVSEFSTFHFRRFFRQLYFFISPDFFFFRAAYDAIRADYAIFIYAIYADADEEHDMANTRCFSLSIADAVCRFDARRADFISMRRRCCFFTFRDFAHFLFSDATPRLRDALSRRGVVTTGTWQMMGKMLMPHAQFIR